ncbi:MAG TPA: type II toxin-antitoxin system prevent-host-death family antitoxin [Caulobacteraceae bacterium]|nr:type II toxin-antitoxin system prevent-host-death family antitoxin [Caulobacteraceae bacterium]
MAAIEVAKATRALSKLVRAVESGVESEIILTRDGRPAARLIPLAGRPDQQPKTTPELPGS